MTLALAAAALAACGGSGANDDVDFVDSPGASGDAPPDNCNVVIDFTPKKPVAGATTVVRLRALAVNAGVILGYTWTVVRNGTVVVPTEPALADNSEATFVADVATAYAVRVVLANAGPICFDGQNMVNVVQPGAGEAVFRFHVIPPPGDARPPYDDLAIVTGGATSALDHDLVLPEGGVRNGIVTGPNDEPVPGYLQFRPITQRDALVEAYAATQGGYAARLGDDRHEVLVIPGRGSPLAPQRLTWMPGQSTLKLAAAGERAISGRVRVGAAALAGASVQLTIDGIPTTIGTTDATGAFTVRGVPASGAPVEIAVTPPATRGLPRLRATSAQLALDQELAITYAPVTERDLAGTVVRRGGAPIANAAVAIVGTIPAAATVSTGAVTVDAVGEVRAEALADASGALPQLHAPAAPLSAVIAAIPGDLALTAVNLTSGVPASISAAAMVPVSTEARNAAGPLAGVTLDAIPTGDFALAGTPAVRATSSASGTITLNLAAGATYDLRFLDPGGRAAPLVRTNVTTTTVGATNLLPAHTRVRGLVTDGTQPLRGALVQVLCATCTGLDRTRPLAEGLTGVDGRFTLAVPNPSPAQ
ncbi:MAG: hypothetical protein KIT31_36390 [Deltaproteobacteria bacterium]|nr:hypothetical protein [Deltaproteobacteria bacterium]